MFLIIFNIAVIAAIVAGGFLILFLVASVWELIEKIQGKKCVKNKLIEFISYEIK